MEPKQKFVLEFDEPPAFIYVAESVSQEHVWINGNLQKGWTSLKLSTDMGDLANYEIKGVPIK